MPAELDPALLQQMVVFVGSGKQAIVREAEVVASSKEHDLAVLKVKGAPIPAMALASGELSKEGTTVAFTGFPIGAVLGLYPVTHRGIISSITPTIIPVEDSRQMTNKMLKRLRDPYLVY